MNPVSRRSALLGAAGLLTSIGALAAGCAQPVQTEQEVPTERTITDPSGRTVQLPADPQRVLGVYTSDLDHLIVLGLPLAPRQSIRKGSVGFPTFFPAEPLKGIEPIVMFPEIDFEQVANLAPDLIINGLGYSDGPDVDRFAAVAPTYTYDGFDGDYREDLRALGSALGRSQAADDFLATLAERTQSVRARVAELSTPPTYAIGWVHNDGAVGIYGPQPSGLPGLVFGELGIRTTAAATEIWTELSVESIPKLADVDVFIIAVETANDPAAAVKTVQGNRLWQQLPVVAEDRVVTLSNEMTYASPHAHLQLLAEIEGTLDRLA